MMNFTKDGTQVESSIVREDGGRQNGILRPKYMGTIADKEDMSVMGKSQVLRVSLPTLSGSNIHIILSQSSY